MKHLLQKLLLCAAISTAMTNAYAEATIATWDFTSDASVRASAFYQGSAGYVSSDVDGLSLYVDATNGKFDCVNRTGDVQINAGTIVNVPVSKVGDVVTIVGNYAVDYTIGSDAEAVTVLNKEYSASASDVAKGYVVITATGNTYFYSIKVELNGNVNNIKKWSATWDYANATVMEATMALSGASEAGTVNDIEDNGILLTVEANSASFRNNGNNIQVRSGAVFKVPVRSTRDVITVKGYPGYSYYKIGDSEEVLNGENTYSPKAADVAAGYVAITSTNDNNYFYSISTIQMNAKELVSLTDEAATITFPFNLGTDGQVADFGDASDYFITSKVALGSNLYIKGLDTKGNNQTQIQPLEQESAADETNAIRFLIQPNFGFAFTPTKVSFKATRYGTDGGKIDVAWQNPDVTTVSLAKECVAQRDNGSAGSGGVDGEKVTTFTFNVANATVAEGACGLLLNLYSLGNTKQIGFSDITITGTLNGTEREVPLLNSFTANEAVFAADDVFEASGNQYVATIELSKKATMISATNAITAEALKGTLGTISYEGDETQCVATIPVTLNDITINYVVTFVQKPDFTLTYYNTDGSVMATQLVEKDATIGEFATDYTNAIAAEGYKVRGWFVKESGGRKYTVDDVITGNTNIYAVATEIEVSSDYKKYTFNLANEYFYAEDHEAFCPSDKSACKFHDTTHGWSFYNGDVVEILVGPKATISIALCKYGKATNIVVKKGDEVLATLDGMSETDGDVVAYNYEGEAGVLTLNFEATGEMYIHNVKVVNTTTTNYNSNGSWYFVKAGDASSLVDVIDAVNGINASKDAARSYIFIPNGTYNLGTACLTNISGHNISLIGESQDGVIIKNKPEAEGISVTATILNTGTNNYFQDFTLKNDWDYYGRIAAGDGAGRAVCLQDKGSNTICKNVTMLSYQDTYYSNSASKFYWETSEIHGTVDFLCGDGDVVYNECNIYVEPRNENGKGECTIAAPYQTAGSCDWGYVFMNCSIENKAEKFNLGRAWGGAAKLTYLNTVFTDDASSKINSTRFTTAGMNVAATAFYEYNSVDESGKVVSPASNVLTFTHSTGNNANFETILTAEAAANYTLSNIYPSWTPAEYTKQVTSPEVTLADGVASWVADENAIAYAVYVDGVLADIVTTNTYNAAGATTVEVRAANAMGGFGAKRSQPFEVTPIESVNSAELDVLMVEYYNLVGQRFAAPQRGVNIVRTIYTNGESKTEKVIVK